jgi:hypothetical protein
VDVLVKVACSQSRPVCMYVCMYVCVCVCVCARARARAAASVMFNDHHLIL